MKLTALADNTCKDGDCPAAYRTDRGTAVIQGARVTDPAALRQLHLPAEETAVEVPLKLILDAAKELGLP